MVAGLVMLWLIKSISVALGATRASYVRSFFALSLSVLMTGLLWFVILTYFENIWLRTIATLFFYFMLPTYVFSEILGLLARKALVAHVSSLFITLILMLVLATMLFFSGFFSGIGSGARAEFSIRGLLDLPYTVSTYFKLTKMQSIVNRLCACVEEPACVLTNKVKLLVMLAPENTEIFTPGQLQSLENIKQIMDECLVTFNSLEEQEIHWEKAEAEQRRALRDDRARLKARQVYSADKLDALNKYLGKTILVWTKHDDIYKGELIKKTNKNIELREFRDNGTYFVRGITLRVIKQVEIEEE